MLNETNLKIFIIIICETVADDKENDLMVQLDSRPAGTVSARPTPRPSPRSTPARTFGGGAAGRSLSPISAASSNFKKNIFNLILIELSSNSKF